MLPVWNIEANEIIKAYASRHIFQERPSLGIRITQSDIFNRLVDTVHRQMGTVRAAAVIVITPPSRSC